MDQIGRKCLEPGVWPFWSRPGPAFLRSGGFGALEHVPGSVAMYQIDRQCLEAGAGFPWSKEWLADPRPGGSGVPEKFET